MCRRVQELVHFPDGRLGVIHPHFAGRVRKIDVVNVTVVVAAVKEKRVVTAKVPQETPLLDKESIRSQLMREWRKRERARDAL